jgi:hypothetical protein
MKAKISTAELQVDLNPFGPALSKRSNLGVSSLKNDKGSSRIALTSIAESILFINPEKGAMIVSRLGNGFVGTILKILSRDKIQVTILLYSL